MSNVESSGSLTGSAGKGEASNHPDGDLTHAIDNDEVVYVERIKKDTWGISALNKIRTNHP